MIYVIYYHILRSILADRPAQTCEETSARPKRLMGACVGKDRKGVHIISKSCVPTLAASFSCQSPSTTAGAPTAASIPELDAARSSDKVCQGHSRVQRQQLAAPRPHRANETASSKKAAAPPPKRASKSDGSSGAERESTAGGGERESSAGGGGGNGGGKFPSKAVMASMGVATAEVVRKYEVMALGMLQPATQNSTQQLWMEIRASGLGLVRKACSYVECLKFK